MNTHVSRALYGALFVGGLSLLGATAANAADTSGEDGILSGTQIVAGVTAPITASGNAISILGDSSSSSATPAAAPAPVAPAPAAPAPATTSGLDGVLSGTQGLISVAVPITVEGNSISVVGDSSSSGTPAAAPAPAPAPAPAAPATTTGEDSVAGGTQALIDVNLPITVGGNAISVLGDTEATNTGSAPAEAAPATTAPVAPTAGGTTTGEDSIAGGTQIIPVVDIPVTVGGNAISVLGDSESTNTGTITPVGGTPAAPAAGGSTTGEDSVLGGTQIVPVVDVPLTVGGNAISVLGDSEATNTGTTGTTTPVVGTPAAPAAGSTTTGDDSVAGGTQIIPVVNVPVAVGGNAISVIGDSESTTTGSIGTPTSGTPTGTPVTGGTTTGDDSILGGTQIIPVISLPIDLGGNAISVIGDTDTTTTDPTTPVDPTDPTTPVDPTDPTTPVDPTEPATDTTNPTDTTGTTGVTGTSVPTVTLAAAGGSTVVVADASAELATTGVEIGNLGGIAILILLMGSLLLIARRWATQRG
jgi:hypothetical protein